MKANMNRHIAFLIDELEGGDKVIEDAGGVTKFGISQRAFPDLDIRRLTRTHATKLYIEEYWKLAHCDEMPFAVDFVLFDGAVQHGVVTAIKLMQRALGVKVDGVIGPKTMKAIEDDASGMLELRMIAERISYYTAIVEAHPHRGEDFVGWMRRVVKVIDYIGE